MKLSETGDLPGVLNLKIGVKAMITSNINIDETLVNSKQLIFSGDSLFKV